ncbi:MAG: hypothetical protein PHW76_02945 [Alphaproteobacteria bacterium]|nr:hypothetical protein [Alphaproteobacteria bacterium]
MRRILLALMLGACAPSMPVYKPVEVQVPVVEPCIWQIVQKPDFAMAHVGTDDDIAAKTRAALVELSQRRAYEAELEAQVDGCR